MQLSDSQESLEFCYAFIDIKLVQLTVELAGLLYLGLCN